MDVSSHIKERMLEELEGNYIRYYQDSTVFKDTEKAYEKVMEEHDKKVAEEVSATKEQEFSAYKMKQEKALSSIISKVKEKDVIIEKQKEQSIENRVQREIEKKVDNKIKIGEWITSHKNGLLLLCLMLLIVLGIILFLIFRKEIDMTDALWATIIATGTFAIQIVFLTIINALEEKFTNREELEKRYTRKLRKKYRNLL